jgi:hypothetical protein
MFSARFVGTPPSRKKPNYPMALRLRLNGISCVCAQGENWSYTGEVDVPLFPPGDRRYGTAGYWKLQGSPLPNPNSFITVFWTPPGTYNGIASWNAPAGGWAIQVGEQKLADPGSNDCWEGQVIPDSIGLLQADTPIGGTPVGPVWGDGSGFNQAVVTGTIDYLGYDSTVFAV